MTAYLLEAFGRPVKLKISCCNPDRGFAVDRRRGGCGCAADAP